MKNSRIFIIANIVVLLICTLSGCAVQQAVNIEEDPNAVPADSYEINWYFYGDSNADTVSVESKINEYLKDKINATVKLNRLPANRYPKTLSAMIEANEYYDICFTATWGLDYKSNAAKGAWLPLDEQLDKYMLDIKNILGMNVLNDARINGKIYAIPAYKEMATQVGWVYRKDLADKYGIDMENVKTLDDLIPVLKLIQEKEPDIKYPIDWSSDRTPYELIGYEPIAGRCVGIYYDKYPCKVVNLLETPEFVEACSMARKYYEQDLVKKDVLQATDFMERLKDGKVFAFIERLKPGKANELAKNFTFPLGQVGVTPIYATPSTGSMMAVSKTSKNPARVMRFLNLLNSDKYLNNLVNYGIEGKHYTKLEGEYIDIIPGSGYTLAGMQWMTGNVFLNYLVKGEEPDKMQKLLDFNSAAIKPPHYGFVFDPVPVQQEISACTAVESEFQLKVTMGSMPIEPLLSQYKEAIKAAGIDKVLQEAQRQLDAYVASKKQ